MDILRAEEEEREQIDKAFQANPTEVEAQWRQLKVAATKESPDAVQTQIERKKKKRSNNKFV
jgi:hypothetical protein